MASPITTGHTPIHNIIGDGFASASSDVSVGDINQAFSEVMFLDVENTPSTAQRTVNQRPLAVQADQRPVNQRPPPIQTSQQPAPQFTARPAPTLTPSLFANIRRVVQPAERHSAMERMVHLVKKEPQVDILLKAYRKCSDVRLNLPFRTMDDVKKATKACIYIVSYREKFGNNVNTSDHDVFSYAEACKVMEGMVKSQKRKRLIEEHEENVVNELNNTFDVLADEARQDEFIHQVRHAFTATSATGTVTV